MIEMRRLSNRNPIWFTINVNQSTKKGYFAVFMFSANDKSCCPFIDKFHALMV